MEISKIDVWLDRYTKSWVVQRFDENGNQIGEADYVGTKPEANKIKEDYVKNKIKRKEN